jgi:colicin import membrane protein
MILKLVSAALMLLVITPLYAEDVLPPDETATEVQQESQQGAQPEAPASPIEQRIRAYRESFDRRQADLPSPDPVVSKRQQEIQAQMEARRQAYIKQREERRALAEKWREARNKYREAQMETWLKQAEDRQQREISRHEALRNQAEERHNYLVQNYEKMVEDSLQRQIEAANRHEEMRKQAEERRKKLTTLRANIKDMTREERRAEIARYREELFGEQAGPRYFAPPPRAPLQARPPYPPHAASPPAAE